MKKSIEERLKSISKAPKQVFIPPAPKVEIDRAVRNPTYKFAQIHTPAGASVRAIVKNLSAAGARLQLETIDRLPKQVEIVISDIGLRKTAKVVWQRGEEFGLKF